MNALTNALFGTMKKLVSIGKVVATAGQSGGNQMHLSRLSYALVLFLIRLEEFSLVTKGEDMELSPIELKVKQM